MWLALLTVGMWAPSNTNHVYNWLKILQAKPLFVCACVRGCLLSCMCTTEHSLVLWLCAGELCLIFETQKRRKASWCIIKHTLLLPLLTCAKSFVNVFVFVTSKPRDLDSSRLIPPSLFFCPSIRIFPPNQSLPTHEPTDWHSHRRTGLGFSQRKRLCPWHVFYDSWIQIRTHEIIIQPPFS